jgi:hypothetical protein
MKVLEIMTPTAANAPTAGSLRSFLIYGSQIQEFDLSFGDLMKHLGIPHVGPLIEKGYLFVQAMDMTHYPLSITAGTIENIVASLEGLKTVLARYQDRQIDVKINSGQIRTTPSRIVNDLASWAESLSAKNKTRRKSKLEKIADLMGVEVIEPDTRGSSFSRVEWQRPNTIKTHDPETVSLTKETNQFPGVYALHVGDPEFWFYQLIHDYGYDETAFELQIFPARGDILVEDVQYSTRDGIQNDQPNPAGDVGDSAILLTTRPILHLGKDFRYTNQLFLRKQYISRKEFRYYVERKPITA